MILIQVLLITIQNKWIFIKYFPIYKQILHSSFSRLFHTINLYPNDNLKILIAHFKLIQLSIYLLVIFICNKIIIKKKKINLFYQVSYHDCLFLSQSDQIIILEIFTCFSTFLISNNLGKHYLVRVNCGSEIKKNYRYNK